MRALPVAGSETVWIFDLDNTLYPKSVRLFDQIDRLMTRFIAEHLGVDEADADHVRRDTWARYGATLSGLMAEHGVDPADFLEATHRLDLSGLAPDPRLSGAIAALPGRRVIHTNGPRAHAARVLAARGLTDLFGQVVALEDTGHVPKPQPESVARMLHLTGVDPARAVMIEDSAPNLAEPHRLGMVTVLVCDETQPGGHVHHVSDDLAGFLEGAATLFGAGGA